MDDNHSSSTGYLVAAVLGMIGGAILVAVATRAIPKMMSGMMREMMTRRRDGHLEPSEF